MPENAKSSASGMLREVMSEARTVPRNRKSTMEIFFFKQKTAYEIQGDWSSDVCSSDLERFLREKGAGDTLNLVDPIIDRLHARDAILVQFGGDRLGFVHRGFQEYFAAQWMAEELEDSEFLDKLLAEPAGWNETLYLAVAQLPDRQRRRTLLELLRAGRAEFALACLKAAAPEDPWLRQLVQFLSRYTSEGREHRSLPVTECAEACAAPTETQAARSSM